MNLTIDQATGSRTAPASDRDAAARLLRRARRADPVDEAHHVERAFAALPDSRPAIRLAIGSRLAREDWPAVDAALDIALLQRPTDPSLACLRAWSLYFRRRYDEAGREIDLAIRQRPGRIGSLELAGLIAAARGEHDRAARLLEVVHQRRPVRIDITEGLFEVRVALGQLDRARSLLRHMASPPARLAAQLLAAEGRRLEAIALLDAHLARASDDQARDAALELLIDVLADSHQWIRIERLARSLTASTPRALLHAARALLPVGRFRAVRILLDRLPTGYKAHDSAIAIRLIADAMSSAAQATSMPFPAPPDCRSLAITWRKGLLGALIDRHRRSSRPARTHAPSALRPIVRRTLATLERQVTRRGKQPGDRQIEHPDASLCRKVLAASAIAR